MLALSACGKKEAGMKDFERLSFCMPVLNEQKFLPIILANISKFLGCQLVITDGGSSDDTIEIIKRFAVANPSISVDLKESKQTGEPYTNDWKESEVRNDLLSRCERGIICVSDADEILEPPVIETAMGMLLSHTYDGLRIPWLPFWGSLYRVRLSTKSDPYWLGGAKVNLIRNKEWFYPTKAHHCTLATHRRPNVYLQPISSGCVYHIHYGFGSEGMKKKDNRRADLLRPELNISMYKVPDIVEDADWSDKYWVTDVGWIIEVKTQEYNGPWPAVLKKYL